MKKVLWITILNLFCATNLFASDRVINLVVAYKTVYFAGKPRKAIAVNNQIPAPTLHFKEGEHVSINVYNRLDQETAIHWHGMLVSWQMDGVLGVSQRGIQPGQFFRYDFTLHQAGTYWYHAHAGLQEQQGLYGAFLIDPSKAPSYKYNKDYVVVLSDWSNTSPDQILANLKKEGDYYSPRFPLQPSLAKFIHDYRKADAQERKKLIDDYKMMQQMRMSIYDISDVAFDAFLLNGQPNNTPWRAPVKVGDIVRLRFIGAAGSTIFHVKIPETTMQMVHVQGNDVIPYSINDFTIAPGETYDVLVKIQKNDPYIIYAESADTLGATYGALVTRPNQFVDFNSVIPFPEPLPVTREMMDNMMKSAMDHGSMSAMNMQIKGHEMQGMHHETQHKSLSMMNMDYAKPIKKKTKKDKIKNDVKHEMHSMEMDSIVPIQKSASDQMQMNHDMSNIKMPMDYTQHQMQNVQKTNTKETKSISTTKKSNKMQHDMSDMNMVMDHSKHRVSDKTKKMHQMSSMSMPMKNMSMRHSVHKTMKDKMDHNMKNMNHKMSMNHSMNMPTEPTNIGDLISLPSTLSGESTTSGTKYENLSASIKTNDPSKPIKGVIRMQLFGYMDRFIWFINGLPEYKAKPIILEPGQRYRIIFTNTSMMHHPMHMHGHWFILRKGLGSYDPLLHTLDVAPGATMIVDVDTDASGQWFFHCHLLYHMVAGMSRVFQYSTLLEITKGEASPQDIVKDTQYHNRPIVRVDEKIPIDAHLVKHPMAHPMRMFFANFLDVGADPFSNVQRVNYKGLYGFDYDKLELMTKDGEIKKGTVENADLDIFYWRLISQFWAVKGGVNYFYLPALKPYWQPGIGIEGLLPYFIDTDVRGYFYHGSAKLDAEFSRDTQLTNNSFLRLGIRGIFATKTVKSAQIGNGLNQMRFIVHPYYRVMPGLNLFAEYEHDRDYGAFRNLQIAEGESGIENTLTFGLAFLF